jgi:hypothetical protein
MWQGQQGAITLEKWSEKKKFFWGLTFFLSVIIHVNGSMNTHMTTYQV